MTLHVGVCRASDPRNLRELQVAGMADQLALGDLLLAFRISGW
jgi:hypothetical protein